MSKQKRKYVPNALHSELSEYSSLLRALETSDHLDVAKRLTEPPPNKKQKVNKIKESQRADLPGDEDFRSGAGNSSPLAPPFNQTREEEDVEYFGVGTLNSQDETAPYQEERTRKRVAWTLWPLLAKDLSVPEWGLQDEIDAIVRQCSQNNYTSAAADDDGDLEEVGEAPTWLPHLTVSASTFLSSLFALLAHHTPARPQSAQDRLNPINWKMVLDILGSCGHVDAELLSNVRRRMEAIYGPYEGHGLDRLEIRATAKSRPTVLIDAADDALLTAPSSKRCLFFSSESECLPQPFVHRAPCSRC
ncbi:hypothetical protein R3P38DRAFT_3309742 [Favolaschia claudopus]|uniref:Uncharacterized protein n=1 Tax=Favolaschia claudopus TaxID=2862362 RepID=A0AAW0CVQ6_9AGAR